MPLPEGTTGTADFSPCGGYRHRLTRQWGHTPSLRTVCFYPCCCGFSVVAQEGRLVCVYSLRSDGCFDVGAFASEEGGGGHQRSAGFSLNLGPNHLINSPVEELRELLAVHFERSEDLPEACPRW